MEEESNVFGMGQGCGVHGDEALRECSVCNSEFCKGCYPSMHMCPECSVSDDSVDEDENEPDFEDVEDLSELIGDDDEVEKLLSEDEEIPPEDLIDSDRRDL